MINKLLCFMGKEEKEKLRNIVSVLEYNDYLYKAFSLLEIELILLKKVVLFNFKQNRMTLYRALFKTLSNI